MLSSQIRRQQHRYHSFSSISTTAMTAAVASTTAAATLLLTGGRGGDDAATTTTTTTTTSLYQAINSPGRDGIQNNKNNKNNNDDDNDEDAEKDDKSMRSNHNMKLVTKSTMATNTTRPSRYFSTDNWIVPKKITIPEDKIDLSFTRSSGAGGQNVNKVNTQVVIRFNVMDATWIPLEVRQRIMENESNRINKDGYMIVNSQEYRTQAQNRKDALDKLEEIILQNYPRPKVRKMRKGISEKAKVLNKENKRRKSDVKKSRKRVDF